MRNKSGSRVDLQRRSSVAFGSSTSSVRGHYARSTSLSDGGSIYSSSNPSSTDSSRKTSMESNASSNGSGSPSKSTLRSERDLPGLFVTSMTLNERPTSRKHGSRTSHNLTSNSERVKESAKQIISKSFTNSSF